MDRLPIHMYVYTELSTKVFIKSLSGFGQNQKVENSALRIYP